MIGKEVFQYRVLDKLGRGGMGEVFLALDTKLDRKVALKFLPQSREDDPVARRRFLREARSAAALDHPFIAHIHEVGEWQGRSFLAMEYLEGVGLDERLAEGPVPIEEALQIAIEIAEALDAAHSLGIIHRDLKPSNIMLLRGGRTKVTDFGLAKFVEIPGSPNEKVEMVTGLTGSGMRLGTIPYMSPEQVSGEELDTRSDIFSFGTLLYEIVSGVHPFKRSDSLLTAGAILREDPPSLAQLDSHVSDILTYVLGKMLAKKPRQRYQSALEIRTDLVGLLEDLRLSSRKRTRSELAPRTASKNYLRLILPLVGLTVALMVFWPQEADKAVLRLEWSLPEGKRLAHYYRQGLAVSPDGTSLAAVSGMVENPYIFPNGVEIILRRLDESRPRVVPGTKDGFQPFFSPDGRWLGFTQYSLETNSWFLKKVRVDGGEPVTLCECEARWGATWTDTGSIIFGSGPSGLFRISEAGGEAEQITFPDSDAGELSHRLPSTVPGVKAVLFTVPLSDNPLSNSAKVCVYSLETGETRDLVEGWDGRYVPTGHLVFARDGNLRAVAFDGDSLQVRGPDLPVLEGVNQSLFTVNPSLRTGGMQLDYSSSGLLAYAQGSVFPELKNTVAWVDEQGNEEMVGVEPRNYFTLRLSDDSSKVLLTTLYPPQDVWLYDLDRKTIRRQTFEGNGTYAVWGPEEDQFTYCSEETGAQSLYMKPIDSGPFEPQLLHDGTIKFLRPSFWAADGRYLTFVEANPGNRFDIGYLSVSGEQRAYLQTRFSEQYPEISPDGKWMLYTSNESDRQEVYVSPFPNPGKTVQVSAGGGYEPAWSKSGDKIYFRWRQEFFSARVRSSGANITVDRPRKIFEGDYGSVIAVRSYDVARDGRLLLLKRPDKQALETAIGEFFPSRVQVVSNWFEELRRKLPSS